MVVKKKEFAFVKNLQNIRQPRYLVLFGLNMTKTMHSEPEFLNIDWRLESRLFATSCLFNGQKVQQGSYKLQFLLNDIKDCFITILTDLKSGRNAIIKCFIIKNTITIKLKPCTRTFS